MGESLLRQESGTCLLALLERSEWSQAVSYYRPLSPSIQPVQIPLQGLSTLQQVDTPTQLGVICKFAEGALDPLVQIIDKDVEENLPQYQALGDITRDRPPTGFNSIHHHSLGPALQPVFNPVESIPI
ncbi:hypothetical protein llap_1781 [Limosa lapponica baueri]|uniref:Uncharacterized protein n=1 Tax=Limosa lapponica baueri TaxID=1758121 RepID=A0A2I0UPH8_LIMLA|nr:hypothetical protein llap_1781 [Limosa lapponica baueri]